MPLEEIHQEPGDMTALECLHELAQETSVAELRTLVEVKRYFRDMAERVLSGKVEVDVQAGIPRRVLRPEYKNV